MRYHGEQLRAVYQIRIWSTPDNPGDRTRLLQRLNFRPAGGQSARARAMQWARDRGAEIVESE